MSPSHNVHNDVFFVISVMTVNGSLSVMFTHDEPLLNRPDVFATLVMNVEQGLSSPSTTRAG